MELNILLKNAEERYNRELIRANSKNLTQLCYAEGYLDAIKEAIKCISTKEKKEK